MRAPRRLLRAVLAAGLLATAVVAAVGEPATPVHAVTGCTLCSGGEYHPLPQPVRVDSRTSLLGTSYAVPTLANWPGGAPAPSDVLAVVVSISSMLPKADAWLKAYPDGANMPSAMVMPMFANKSASNLAVVPVQPTTGQIRVATVRTVKVAPTAGVDVTTTVDVVGWLSTSTYPGTNAGPMDPADYGLRLKSNGATVRIGAAQLTAATPSVTLPAATPTVGAAFGVDPATIKAVLLNIGVYSPSTNLDLLVQASDGTSTTRSVAAVKGQGQMGLALATLGPAGLKVDLQGAIASTSVVVRVDVVGVFVDSPRDETTAGRIIPLAAPFRVLDTRAAAFGAVRLGPNQAEDWSFAAFSNSITLNGAPIGVQSALLGNLISMGVTRVSPTVPVSSGLTLYSPQRTRPPQINVVAREVLPTSNAVLVSYGTNQVARTHNIAGYAHYLLDVYAVVLA